MTGIDGLEGAARHHAVRADRLAREGRRNEAVAAFHRAIALAQRDSPAARELSARVAWLRPRTPHLVRDTPPAGG